MVRLRAHASGMAPKLPDPPPPCPRCGGRVIYDGDRKRRAPPMYCIEPGCGWNTDTLLGRLRERFPER